MSYAKSISNKWKCRVPRVNFQNGVNAYSTGRDTHPNACHVLSESTFKDPSIYSSRKLSDLMLNYLILKSTNIPFLLSFSQHVTKKLIMSPLALPLKYALKKTYYSQFVAGSDLKSSIESIQELERNNVHAIMDYSIESAEGNVNQVLDTLIETSKFSAQNENVRFTCFKMASLASFSLLFRLSQLLDYQVQNPSFHLDWKEALFNLPPNTSMKSVIENLAASAKSGGMIEPTDKTNSVHLTSEELKALSIVVERIESLAAAALENQVPALVDAEQHCIQHAISFLTNCLMKKYNKQRAYILNTYQMYLRASIGCLEHDFQMSEKYQYYFGAKLVRGAYMDSENSLSLLKNVPSPVFNRIEDTHKSYANSVNFMLPRVKGNQAEIVIASHNMNTLIDSTEIMAKNNMRPDSVTFAQLYGMCDHLSYSLANSGYQVCKYVPFGPVEEVIPYLVRRIQENKSVLGTTNLEQTLLLEEIRNKMTRQSASSQTNQVGL